MSNAHKEPITKRERITIWLILMAIQILSPWEYEHQFKDIIAAIKGEVNQ